MKYYVFVLKTKNKHCKLNIMSIISAKNKTEFYAVLTQKYIKPHIENIDDMQVPYLIACNTKWQAVQITQKKDLWKKYSLGFERC